ncbi:uncharacterized protein LOC578763 isoform X2 [Strongylocentrotus purpuratus]|uniref:Histone deacetylase domain-containing protein n=1 Tax=Strongylocentrotus purpuratus TaxID=7668 RepID=A0A7M7NHV8_STRPU|nr:uncharacterized protein LOC578763 isoform X2 [Strongylocentrotus purpuratus]
MQFLTLIISNHTAIIHRIMKLSCPLTFSILSAYCRRRSGLLLHKSESVKQIHGGQKYTPASVVFHTSNPDKETPHISNAPDLPIVHHDGYESYLPPGHRFQMRKFNKLRDVLLHDGVISKKQMSSPVHVTKDELIRVHTEEYIEKFFEGKTSAKEQRVTGFTWSEGLVSRCRYETGGTILAAELALGRGLVCNTGGGTHHAFPEHGAGFCLLNDMAVAASLMVHRGKVDRVLIIDLDVHQGDGTALIFQEDPSVFTLSVHCGKNYPLKKQQSDLDVSVDRGTGDDDYMRIIQDHIPSVLTNFRPGLVFFDAGVDPHKDDALGYLELTDQGLFRRDYWVINEVIQRGIPCVTVIGGGYDKDIDRLAARHSIVHRAAKKVWQERRL